MRSFECQLKVRDLQPAGPPVHESFHAHVALLHQVLKEPCNQCRQRLPSIRSPQHILHFRRLSATSSPRLYPSKRDLLCPRKLVHYPRSRDAPVPSFRSIVTPQKPERSSDPKKFRDARSKMVGGLH